MDGGVYFHQVIAKPIFLFHFPFWSHNEIYGNIMSIIYNTNVYLHEYDTTTKTYHALGDARTLGCVILMNPPNGTTTSTFELMFYNEQKQTILRTGIIEGKMKCTLQENHYVHFLDDKHKNWTMRFKDEEGACYFLKVFFILTSVHSSSSMVKTLNLSILSSSSSSSVQAGDIVGVKLKAWKMMTSNHHNPLDLFDSEPIDETLGSDVRKIKLGDERLEAHLPGLHEGIFGMTKKSRRILLLTQKSIVVEIELCRVKKQTPAAAAVPAEPSSPSALVNRMAQLSRAGSDRNLSPNVLAQVSTPPTSSSSSHSEIPELPPFHFQSQSSTTSNMSKLIGSSSSDLSSGLGLKMIETLNTPTTTTTIPSASSLGVSTQLLEERKRLQQQQEQLAQEKKTLEESRQRLLLEHQSHPPPQRSSFDPSSLYSLSNSIIPSTTASYSVVPHHHQYSYPGKSTPTSRVVVQNPTSSRSSSLAQDRTTNDSKLIESSLAEIQTKLDQILEHSEHSTTDRDLSTTLETMHHTSLLKGIERLISDNHRLAQDLAQAQAQAQALESQTDEVRGVNHQLKLENARLTRRSLSSATNQSSQTTQLSRLVTERDELELELAQVETTLQRQELELQEMSQVCEHQVRNISQTLEHERASFALELETVVKTHETRAQEFQAQVQSQEHETLEKERRTWQAKVETLERVHDEKTQALREECAASLERLALESSRLKAKLVEKDHHHVEKDNVENQDLASQISQLNARIQTFEEEERHSQALLRIEKAARAESELQAERQSQEIQELLIQQEHLTPVDLSLQEELYQEIDQLKTELEVRASRSHSRLSSMTDFYKETMNEVYFQFQDAFEEQREFSGKDVIVTIRKCLKQSTVEMLEKITHQFEPDEDGQAKDDDTRQELSTMEIKEEEVKVEPLTSTSKLSQFLNPS